VTVITGRVRTQSPPSLQRGCDRLYSHVPTSYTQIHPVTVATLSQFDFHHTLADTPGISLVMFGTTDCGSCRHLKRVFAEMAVLDPQLHLFEVDAQRDTALVREFEVFHLPSMFLFRDGHFHCPLHSPATPDALRRHIDQALTAPAQEAP